MKKLICLLAAAVIAVTSVGFSASAAKSKTEKVTMPAYTAKTFKFKKSAKRKYLIAVRKNNGNIRATLTDKGASATLKITSAKKTKSAKPSVTVYYQQNGSNITVKKYTFTVTKYEKMTFEDIKVNPKTKKEFTIRNPYSTFIKFKMSNKKNVKFRAKAEVKGRNATYTIKGLKKGKTRVKAYIGNTDKLAGEFTIRVKRVKSAIDPAYKTVTLRYNKHGSSSYMADCHIFLTRVLSDVRYKASYSVEIENIKVADKIIEKSDFNRGEKKKTDFIYSTGKGSTTATIFEKLPKKDRREVGKFTIEVKAAKMKYVAEQNAIIYDNNVLRANENTIQTFLRVGEQTSVRKTIVDSFVNNNWTGSSFKKSQYRIVYRSLNPEYVSIDKNGIVTAKLQSDKEVRIRFRIYFSDNTSFARNIPFTISAKAA